MTVSLSAIPQADFDQRWATWIARGQVQDSRMIFRMRLVFILAAAGALWAGAML